ncbi:MAG: hypothetical protein KF814_12960 [Nitrospiraceae bacterium]|nr:hypothetical protein [Nitrospiraceae bacterium]
MNSLSGLDHALADHPTFHDCLDTLETAIPGADLQAQPILTAIHRAARRTHEALQRIDVTPPLPRSITSGIRCFDCGTGRMESFHTSKEGGYHLCPACFTHRVHAGRARTAT